MTTGNLNKAVKRNIKRFPIEFISRLFFYRRNGFLRNLCFN
ncbi:hypothetical protein [Sphingobacterium sp. xlx-130]